MKRIVFLALAVISSFSAIAQSEEVKERVNKAKDRFIFEFNINQMVRDKSNGFDLDGFSGGFGTYFMYDVVIKDSPISIAPGFGVSVNHFRVNSQIVYTDSSTNFVPWADSLAVKKSKLGVTYLDIPLEIRFRSKPNNNNWQWKLAAGFKFGFLVGSKWKYKGEEFRGIRNDADGNIKFTEHGVPNLERFRYGVTARGGFGPFNLHFFYSLSELFEDGKSTSMQPITFGLSINGL